MNDVLTQIREAAKEPPKDVTPVKMPAGCGFES
jgi:hypothetical protein